MLGCALYIRCSLSIEKYGNCVGISYLIKGMSNSSNNISTCNRKIFSSDKCIPPARLKHVTNSAGENKKLFSQFMSCCYRNRKSVDQVENLCRPQHLASSSTFLRILQVT
jgi:hypothetical protein